jgi:hypothetical protein
MKNILDAFRKCAICRKKRKKDCAQVVIEATDGNKTIKVCEECEAYLAVANETAHKEYDDE